MPQKMQETLIDLNREIISAQVSAISAHQEQFELIRLLDELEKEITSLKTWESDKDDYELKCVGPGAFARASKQTAEGETRHYLCPTCYENRKKVLLQALTGMQQRQRGDIRSCPTCGTHVAFSGAMQH